MGGGNRSRAAPGAAARRLGAAAALLLLLQHPACASEWAHAEGRLVHRRLGIALDDPARPGSRWRRVAVEGTAAAYREPGGASMSLVARCGRPLASPRELARHLLIGIEGRRVVETVPLELAGGEAWLQRLEAAGGRSPLRLKTVTRVHERCILDWVLVEPGATDAAEADFDAWWGSLGLVASP